MNRRSTFYPQPRKSSAAGLLLLFGMLLLLLVIAVIAFLIWRSKTNKKKKSEGLYDLTTRLQERQEVMYNAGEELGIDPVDLKAELFESSNLVCYVYPENGVCDTEFYDLNNGCCELRSNASELAEQARKEMGIDLATMVMVSVLPEIILTDILPRVLQSPRLTIVMNRLRSLGSKAFSKIMSKGIARTVMKAAAVMAAKLAALVAKLLIKLGSGPVGWALLVFDIFTVVQDTADLNNYNSFLDNTMNLETRDIIVYEFAKAMALEGMEFPVLFPFAMLFPTESETAMAEYSAHLMTEHIGVLLEVPGGIEWFVDILSGSIEAEEGGEESPPLNQEEDQEGLDVMDTFFNKVREEHSLQLDKFLFDTLQGLIPSTRKNELVLIPSMSSSKTIGIGISQQAAESWNDTQRAEWFQYLDPFFPPNRPSAEWVPPMVASYTDTYLIPNANNPGTSNAPNIVTKTLPEKVTLMYPFATLVTFCEKPRTSAKYKTPVDPTEFGVTFDPISGVCNFTRAYCQRYVIDFKTKTWKDGTAYNNCIESDVQKGLGMIFGDTNVRNTRLWFEDPDQAAKNFSDNLVDTHQRREEEHGAGVAALMTWVDPLGIGEGFGRNIDEQLAGRDKYCDPADTCKEFHVKHGGGNFMGWSARDKDGQIYSQGQGFQNQVKTGEDHTFFVPEGGYFRAKCDPGESMNVQYEDIENPIRFSCWFGKIKKNPGKDTIWTSAGDFLKDDAGPTVLATLETAGNNFQENVGGAVDTYVEDVEDACTNGNAGDCLGTTLGGAVPVIGSFVATGLNAFAPPGSSSGRGNPGSYGISISDRRLKKDVKKTKLKSPISGLDVYTWKWNEIAMSTYGLKGGDFGFITDEIQDKYVSQDVYGYEYIMENTPVHKALLKLKSKYEVK